MPGLSVAPPRPKIVRLAMPLEPVGAQGRIGLLALATDVNSETDLRRMAPPGVEIFTNRITNANPVTLDNLRAMAGDITRAAGGILPGIRLDAMVYGCTSGTVAIGTGEVARLIRAARPGIPCSNPIDAILAAIGALSVRRLSVLTPYTMAVNEAIAGHLASHDIQVLSIAGFGLDQDDDMTAVPPAALLEAGAQVCDPSAEALFISCTALRVAGMLGPLEQRLGKPVIASNQAMLWHALRLIGQHAPVEGFGRLMALPLPAAA